MSYFYPQAAMTLRVLWEDFKLRSDATLQEVYTLPILARNVVVNINDYTHADTFTAEIDYKSFPFDPRCIRSCGVQIFMEDKKKIYKPDNSLNLLSPSQDNIVFQGFVDEEGLIFSDEKRTVRFEGRDFTSLLIDRKRLEASPIPLTTPLDQLIQSLLGELKELSTLSVDNRTGTSLPTLAKFAPDFGASGGKKNPKKDETYWDIIQDLVGRAGLIAYIELDKLVLSTPRTIYDDTNAVRFVYGRNLSSLEFKRKLGRHKGFNIIVRSLDLEKKEVIDAKIPEDASSAWAQEVGVTNKRVQIPTVNPDGSKGEEKDAPFISFRIPDVASKAKLIEIGQNIYEEMSRQQIEGNFETKNMCAPTVKDQDFNLLKLRIGNAVRVEIEQDDLEQIKRIRSVSVRTQYLINRCYDAKVARALAESLGKFRNVMYTRAVQYTMDSESGFSMKVDFVNFIELPNKLLE